MACDGIIAPVPKKSIQSTRLPHAPLASTLFLREKGDVLEILAGNVVLLSSAALETEHAFGKLAVDRGRVLVGGLGFGATLRGVLEGASPHTEVVVAEKVLGVADLLRGELGERFGRPLDDPRVTVVADDVYDAMGRQPSRWDAILLDVDNGPDWATFRVNARLYSPAGLAVAHAALAPGGFLAVWSGYPADGFLASLRAAGFASKLVPLRERGRVRARAYVGTVGDVSAISPAR
jgi:predicted membrane-bound spermidine synthase